MRQALVILFVILIASCKQEPGSASESSETNTNQEDVNAGLEHLVFFSLKDSLSTEDHKKFKDLLLSLEDIEGVIEVEVNSREDVGDTRALDYDMLMTVEFEAYSHLKSYAIDPYHLQVRDSLMRFLSAPPATFDMIPADQ